MPGFRVWTVSAKHNGGRIACAGENCKNNHIKLQRFRRKLAERGLALSDSQLRELG